jgi:hypothetical protein
MNEGLMNDQTEKDNFQIVHKILLKLNLDSAYRIKHKTRTVCDRIRIPKEFNKLR